MSEPTTEAAEAIEEAAERVESEPQQPGEKVFTQSEVEALLAKEAAKAKRRVKRELESKMTEAPKNNQEPTTDAGESPVVQELREKLERLEAETQARNLESDFLRMAAGADLDDVETDMVRTMIEVGKVEQAKAYLDRKRAADQPPQRKGPGPNTPAAPNGAAPGTVSDNPMDWPADVIAQKRANGTFLGSLNDYRSKLPGGGGGLFPAKTPGKK